MSAPCTLSDDDFERTLEIDVKMAKDIDTHRGREGAIPRGPFAVHRRAWVVGLWTRGRRERERERPR